MNAQHTLTQTLTHSLTHSFAPHYYYSAVLSPVLFMVEQIFRFAKRRHFSASKTNGRQKRMRMLYTLHMANARRGGVDGDGTFATEPRRV